MFCFFLSKSRSFFNFTFCRDIPSSESSRFSNWLHRDLSAELVSKIEPEVSPISSSCSASAPAASVSDVSQQLQTLSVASPDGLQSPTKPVSPSAEPIVSASIPSAIATSSFSFLAYKPTGDDDEIVESEDALNAPVASSQVCSVRN